MGAGVGHQTSVAGAILAAAVVLAPMVACGPPGRAEPAGADRTAAPAAPSPPASGDWPEPPAPWSGARWQAAQAGVAGPAGPAAALVPTGLALAGGSGVEGIVADGTGALWVDAAWQVARIDPASGQAQRWDAADDATFGRVERLVASPGPGVWLVERHRARLFDGTRFAVDLPVPAQYRGDGPIAALVQRGPEVWVGSRAGVARWVDGRWSMVGLGDVVSVVALAVDSAGVVWASGDQLTPAGARSRVVRYDGQRWSVAGQGPQPRAVIELVADPGGGLVARRGALAPAVHRFEAGVWSDLSAGMTQTRVGELADQALAIAPDGRVWLAGRGGVAARMPLGSWQPVVRPSWAAGGEPADGPADAPADVPPGDEPLDEPLGVAVARGTAFAADREGVVRLRGSATERIWSDPGIRGTGPLADPMPASGALVAAGAQDAWIQPDAWYSSQTVRFRAGAWATVRPPDEAWWNGVVGGVLTVADDAAVWAVGSTGLVRRAAGGAVWDVILPEVSLDHGRGAPPHLWPGRAGSVWLRWADPADTSRWSLLEVDPAGTSRQVPAPGRRVAGLAADEDWRGTAQLLPAPDGSVWAVEPVSDPDSRPGHVVLRWQDGRWQRITRVPGGWPHVDDLLVTRDGALWVSASGVAEGQQILARYAGGRWAQVPVALGSLRALGDEACGIEGGPPGARWWVGEDGSREPGRPSLCVGGQPLRVHRLLDLPVVALDVAPDGSVWVLGEQLARLPARAG